MRRKCEYDGERFACSEHVGNRVNRDVVFAIVGVLGVGVGAGIGEECGACAGGEQSPGDIPDNLAFVKYTNEQGGYSFTHAEGSTAVRASPPRSTASGPSPTSPA